MIEGKGERFGGKSRRRTKRGLRRCSFKRVIGFGSSSGRSLAATITAATCIAWRRCLLLHRRVAELHSGSHLLGVELTCSCYVRSNTIYRTGF